MPKVLIDGAWVPCTWDGRRARELDRGCWRGPDGMSLEWHESQQDAKRRADAQARLEAQARHPLAAAPSAQGLLEDEQTS